MINQFFSATQQLINHINFHGEKFKNFETLSPQDQSQLVEEICSITRNMNVISHALKHHIDWSGAFHFEWYNHLCDLYYQFPIGNNSHWIERGVFSNFVIKNNANVLELCCGDGFFAHHFYATKARKVTSLDFDEGAILSAQKNYGSNKKLNFIKADIRKEIPKSKYDNIVWDAAIEHFTEDEISNILSTIKSSLNENGVLSGQTIKNNGIEKQLEHHEKEFESKEEIKILLEKFFKHVVVLETVHTDRHNFYFFASDEFLPFSSI